MIATLSTTQNSIGTGAASIGTGSPLCSTMSTPSTPVDVTVANTFTGAGLLRLNFA
ncbi:MAG: hypothetical protein U1G05_12025 [Kiritimatiellia bacterium]